MNYENYYNSMILFNGVSFDEIFDDETPEGVQIYYDRLLEMVKHLVCERIAQ